MESKTCPQCGKVYGADDRFCTIDGAALVAASGGSLIGTVLADRFLVMDKLGEGGMGEVYLAEHVRMKRKVALKLMRPWMLGDPVAVGRFHREAENASQISHPNVAQVYDFGETAERVVYLAMEFVEGEPLSRILDREQRVNLVRATEIVRQIGEALTAAHALGILHRDLKPDNVMVGRTRYGTDQIKLVDFGIARAMNRTTQQFTSTGLVVGTPDYMSPEQLSGDELDGRSDLYALALIAFRLLTGGSAYSESSSGESLVSRLTGKPKPLGALRPDVVWPDSLQAAFNRALAPDPADRFADAMEFVAELDAAVQEMPLGSDEQSYLVALSQRHPTPARGGLVLDTATPVRPSSAVRLPTPPTGTMAEAPARQVTEAREEAREVPRQPMLEVPAPSETPPAPAPKRGAEQSVAATVTPSRSGSRVGIGAGVAVAAAAAIWFATRGGSAPEPPAEVAAVETPAPAAAPITPAAPAPKAAGVSIDSAALQTARRATVAVWGVAGARGAAVIVDSSGLAFTAASLVPPDSVVSVFLDPNTRLKATVLTVDRAKGIATLLLPLRRCTPRCAVVVPPAADPSAGDSAAWLPPSARGDGETRRTTITTFDGATIATAVTNRPAAGTPLVSAAGGLVGLAAGNRLIPPTALRDELVRGRAAAKGRSPGEETIPIWPERVVPNGQLDSAATDRARSRLTVYQLPDQKDLRVLAMTPQVMKYRVDRATDPMNLSAADPIAAWGPWKTYLAERRAVVMLNAAHKDASFPNWPQKPVNIKNGDVSEVRLFRNDSLLAPIDAGTFKGLVNNGDRSVPMSAVGAWSAFDFLPQGTYRVEVLNNSGTPVVVQPLPPGTLEAIRIDFAWLFR